MDNEFSIYSKAAIDWAKGKIGSKEYTFLCLAFVEDAYEKANHVEIFGGSSAKESADEYGAWNNTGVPPIGAFVFYDCFGSLLNEYKGLASVSSKGIRKAYINCLIGGTIVGALEGQHRSIHSLK